MTLLAHKTKANTPATTTKAPTIAKAISKILEQVFPFVEDEVVLSLRRKLLAMVKKKRLR